MPSRHLKKNIFKRTMMCYYQKSEDLKIYVDNFFNIFKVLNRTLFKSLSIKQLEKLRKCDMCPNTSMSVIFF